MFLIMLLFSSLEINFIGNSGPLNGGRKKKKGWANV